MVAVAGIAGSQIKVAAPGQQVERAGSRRAGRAFPLCLRGVNGNAPSPQALQPVAFVSVQMGAGG